VAGQTVDPVGAVDGVVEGGRVPGSVGLGVPAPVQEVERGADRAADRVRGADAVADEHPPTDLEPVVHHRRGPVGDHEAGGGQIEAEIPFRHAGARILAAHDHGLGHLASDQRSIGAHELGQRGQRADGQHRHAVIRLAAQQPPVERNPTLRATRVRKPLGDHLAVVLRHRRGPGGHADRDVRPPVPGIERVERGGVELVAHIGDDAQDAGSAPPRGRGPGTTKGRPEAAFRVAW